jgi:iron(III) transport system permease protein
VAGKPPGRLARLGLTPEWLLATLAVAIGGLVLLPILTILALALSPAPGVWSHLVSTALPVAVWQTLLLMLGVGCLTLIIGAGAAWLVTMYIFPGRNLLNWLLILPLALPTYITAYCYGEFLDFTGPVQTAIRAGFGFTRYQDYWFPNVRSLGGAVFILSAVLYPYVYLAARASFVQQSHGVIEVTRTLGRGGWSAFFTVALPMARPAIAAGVSLALMECLNDIGAVEYLGVQTLSVSVYTSWLQRSSLAGAAQIALVMFLFVLALISLERLARRHRRFENARHRAKPELELTGLSAWLAGAACLAPLALGFIIPVGVLIEAALQHGAAFELADYAEAAITSLMLAFAAAGVIVVFAFVTGAALRLAPSLPVRAAARLSSIGYALPGTVLALGIIIPLAGLDNAISAMADQLFGVKTGLLFSGSAAALLLAYLIRFQAVALGAIEAGWQRLSPHLDAAARTLGAGPIKTLGVVHIPLLRPALGAAALLVFVDTMKELPATLLLRPFDFETLATQIYTFASQEQFERSAIPALTIVLVGLIPLHFLNRALRPLPSALLRNGQPATPDGS